MESDSVNAENLYEVKIERNVPMKTRDGITLSNDIYRPIPKSSNETFPVLLGKC